MNKPGNKKENSLFWTTDVSLKFVSLDGRGSLFSDLRREEFTAQSISKLFPEQASPDPSLKAHLDALKGKTGVFEFIWKHITLKAAVNPLRNDEGKIIGTLGVALDISDHKRSQMECAALHRFSRKVIDPVSLPELARLLSEESRNLFNHDSFSFFLYDEENKRLCCALAEDTPPGGKKPVVIHSETFQNLSDSKIRRVIRKPTLINRMKEPVSSPFDPFCCKSRVSRSLMITPILWEKEIIGVLVIGSYAPGRYSQRDLETLKSLTNLCSGVLARIRLHEELSASHYAIESSINSVAMINLDETLSYVNRAFLSLWDYESASSITNKPFYRYWKNKNDVANVLREIRRRGWWIGEMSALRRDGSSFDALVSANLVYDETRKPIHIMFFIRDVSVKHLSEKALRMAHFSIERVRDAIFWISPKSRFIYANDAACGLFGYSREEFLCMKISDIDPPYKGKKWSEGWENIKKAKSLLLTDRFLRKKDGAFFPAEISINYLKVENQEFLYAVIRDVSLRKEAEGELKKAHEVYQKVIRNDSGVPYICHFDKGEYEFFNGGEDELAGFSLRKFSVAKFRNYIFEIVVADPEAPHDPYVYGDNFRKGLIERYRADYKMINPRGEEVWLSDCSLPMRDPETGVVTGSFGILHDITIRKRVEKEREILQRLSRKLTLHLSKKEFGRILADESREIFRHDAFWFSLYDEARNAFRDIYVEDTPAGEKKPVPIQFEQFVKSGRKKPPYIDGKPRLVNRGKTSSRSKMIPFGYQNQISRSMMYAPIVWNEKTLGVLSVQSYSPDRYKDNDLRLLQGFANHCAGALTRLDFYEEGEIKNQAIERSLTPLSIVDPEGKVIYSNRAVLELWDYDDLSDVVGRRFNHFFKDPKKSRNAHESLLNQGEWSGELTAVRQDGSTFDVHIDSNLIRDDSGAPLCSMGVFRDLSQIRLTDKALHLAQYTLEKMGDVILWFHPSGAIFYVNGAGCRLLGYSLEEILEMKISSIDPNYTEKQFPAKFAKLKKKKYMLMETTWKTKRGEIIPVEVSANFFQYDGKGMGYAFVRDISSRKMAEQALKESEEKYRLLVENARLVIVSFNEDGALLTMNPFAARVLGGKTEDFLGKTMWDLFPEEAANSHMDQIRKVIRSGKGMGAQHLTRLGNREIWYDVNISPIMDSTGITTGALVVAVDVTEGKR